MRPRDVPANDAPAAARNAAQIGAARSAADALMQQGRYADAVAGYRRLLKLDPASAAVRINLATALLATRKPDKAAHYMLEAFQLIPEALGRYDHVVAILYSLRPELKRAIDWTMHAWPARLSLREIAVHVSLGALATDAFLLWVLESHTICKLGLERFFTCLRAGFVAAIAEGPAPDRDFATIAMPLCCAIARQNFLNDYLFAAEPLEVARASRLRAEIERALTTGEAVAPLAVAACAMYVPLGTLAGAATLIARNFAPPLAGVVRQQVIEPRDEQADRADIAQLTPIVGATSNEVRQHYEENPYPRWVLPASHSAPVTVAAYMRKAFPHASLPALAEDRDIDVLIAGCGTGATTVEFAQIVHGVRITAVDLSLASLAHARRKTREIGIRSVEFGQADIMQLGNLGRSFDVIESTGVLHHLADPLAGWRILLSLLRPGGAMKIGLYSESGRRGIVAAQKRVAERGYTATPQDIRRCRHELADSDLGGVSRLGDFFSVSECRDLLFHTMEHRFTLPAIAAFLAEQGLRFLGFDFPPETYAAYRRRYPDDTDMTSLDNWHRFEIDNPHTFNRMYIFWITKS